MNRGDARIVAALDRTTGGTQTRHEQWYLGFHRDRYIATLATVDALAGGRQLRVLDVGSYPPHLFAALEALGHDVHGITSAHEPIEHPKMAAVDIETDELPWPDEFFDLVLFAEVIEHLPHSPVRALREFRRVARVGGRLVVTTPNLASARQRLRLLLGRSVMYPLDAYFDNDGTGNILFHRHNREYTASELGELLQRTGWQIDRLEDFMAYPRGYRDPAVSSTRMPLATRAKVSLHYVIPGGRDNLLAIATRPA